MRLAKRIGGRLRPEHGLTLSEMLVAMLVGSLVIVAAYTILDTAFGQSTKIASREDAIQRGRLAMERITQLLRSQVCLADLPPLRYADDRTVSLYVDLSSAGGDNPQRHDITWDASAKAIRDEVYTPDVTPPTASTTWTLAARKTLLQDVVAAKDASGRAKPIFSYFAFQPDGTVSATPLATPLGDSDRARAVQVQIDFVVNPTGIDPSRQATTLENDVYVRSADPNDPSNGPRCM